MRFRIVLGVVAISIVTVAALLWRMAGQIKVSREEAILSRVQQAPLPPGAGQLPAVRSGDPAFQKWLSVEAADVDKTSLDSGQKKNELAAVAAHLNPEMAKQLLLTALNGASSAGERILSAYLLAEAGAAARAELVALITAPVANPGPHEPHSEGELKAAQERSLRVMSVEGLIHQAETDPAALTALEQTISNIPDAYIKSYAQKRLDSIKAK